MHLRLFAVLAAASLASACGPRTHAVVMNPENNSGQSGVAVLTELSKSKTRVDVTLKASDDPRPQLMHVHVNHCGEIGVVKFPLNSVTVDPKDSTQAKSSTDIDISFDELRKGPYAINAHDVRDFSLYVACGNTDAP